ncbi:hypothetical protein M0812_14785 [Anaeramoeba flamelloides]|uniref:Uncharacterized protein n=1 Tax=Anaeramoeba flamelloides TaxID=1746091 RepID=A0AAV7ZDF7_9EUKA|nr:hypothetical protein M0812_14785 [Anaeramoeba flamelloides]
MDNKIYVVYNYPSSVINFKVKEQRKLLEEFANSKNKTKQFFDKLCKGNGLRDKFQDSRVSGWTRPSFPQLIKNCLEENLEKLKQYKQLMQQEQLKKNSQMGMFGSEKTIDNEQTNESPLKTVLELLQEERQYWIKFSQVYKKLTDLEKISIGLSDEIKNLSVETILLLASKYVKKKEKKKNNEKIVKKKKEKEKEKEKEENENEKENEKKEEYEKEKEKKRPKEENENQKEEKKEDYQKQKKEEKENENGKLKKEREIPNEENKQPEIQNENEN